MVIPVICREAKFPKVKKQLSRRKLMASSKEALPKVTLNLFLLSVHVARNFVTSVNCFFQP